MFATKEQAVEMAIAEIEATGAEAAIRQFGPCTSVHVAGQNPDDGRIAIAPVWGGTLDDPQIDGWQHRHVEGIIELER